MKVRFVSNHTITIYRGKFLEKCDGSNIFKGIGFARRKRLAFIDFYLLFKGSVTRQDIMEKFCVQKSAATRDFNTYKDKAPGNLEYSEQDKRYFKTNAFKPLIQPNVQGLLIKLAHGIVDVFDAQDDTYITVEAAPQLTLPNIELVTRIIQAVLKKRVLDVSYASPTNLGNVHQLVPHSIFDGGSKWYLRAFDRNASAFNDFELTRLTNVNTLKVDPLETEGMDDDKEWTTLVDLHLVPHSKNVHPGLVKRDFGMKDGVLILEVRAATAGYLLKHWGVDCSKDGKFGGSEYQLRLSNVQRLSGVKSMHLALGYQHVADK